MCVSRTEQKDLEIWILRNNTLDCALPSTLGSKKLQMTLSSLPLSKADNGVVSLPLRRQSRHGGNVRVNVFSYLGRRYKLATYFARKCSLQHIHVWHCSSQTIQSLYILFCAAVSKVNPTHRVKSRTKSASVCMHVR